MLISLTRVPHRIFSNVYHEIELSHKEYCKGRGKILASQLNDMHFPFGTAYSLFCQECEVNLFKDREELENIYEDMSY